RKNEFAGFSISQGEADARFEECVAFLRKAWTSEGRFSHHGRYWNFEDIVVEPRPIQQPHPRGSRGGRRVLCKPGQSSSEGNLEGAFRSFRGVNRYS
ncbi:MAG: LLM class flavin-dependent oxidoreductase, partial [Opitutales bacterium]|nr:LLM class flavin-dependent oxidoreductase [Opitutales bacterium]